MSTILMVAASFVLARIGSMLYQDPRDVTIIHLTFLSPLAPVLPHLVHNSFPSSHGIFAATLLSAVFFVSRPWRFPL